ncbi:hypothetical protein [Xanthobacter autotrophicus]|uniref:hypothetical protein n=1 Tax=Xanthobacter autotrophicus TaxID=280 RepID=UPI00372CD0AC
MPTEDAKPLLRRIREAAIAIWVAGSLLPLMLWGVTDQGLIGSASVAMGLPAAAFCLFVLGDALARAFGPPARVVIGLGIFTVRQMSVLTRAAGQILLITIAGRR